MTRTEICKARNHGACQLSPIPQATTMAALTRDPHVMNYVCLSVHLLFRSSVCLFASGLGVQRQVWAVHCLWVLFPHQPCRARSDSHGTTHSREIMCLIGGRCGVFYSVQATSLTLFTACVLSSEKHINGGPSLSCLQ